LYLFHRESLCDDVLFKAHGNVTILSESEGRVT